MEEDHKTKVAFIHGRPSGHPTHAAYARSLGSTFFFEDRIMRWQDLKTNKARRYLSWILNALFFPKLNKWDIILTECVRVPPLIQKRLGLLKRSQKLIALMSDESLYFTESKIYPKLTRYLMLSFWESCDVIICVGSYQSEIAKRILDKKHHAKIKTIYNGLPQETIAQLGDIQVDLSTKNILFIGNVASYWRAEYKGLDKMLLAFSKCAEELNLQFYIIGEVKPYVQEKLLALIAKDRRERIHFEGKVKDLRSHFEKSSLYLHTAKGEAWGNSVMEAMAAGVPCIVSLQTGTKQLIEMVDPNLVVEEDELIIAGAIQDYFRLEPNKLKHLSAKVREIVSSFTEEMAIQEFKKAALSSIALKE